MPLSKRTSRKKTVKKKAGKRTATTGTRGGKKAAKKKTTAKKAVKKKVGKKTGPQKTGGVSSRRKPAAKKKGIAKRRTAVKKTAKKTTASSRTMGMAAATGPGRAKTATKPAQSSGPKYEFSREIPHKYDQTYLRALPRDPEWMFLYWEITPDSLQRLSSEIGDEGLPDSKRVVRIIDTTEEPHDGTNAQVFYDTEVGYYADNWYLKVPDGGRTYIAEIGHLASDGTFGVLARSNPVAMPRGEVSYEAREEWGTVDTDELIRFSGEGLKTGHPSSPDSSRGYFGSGSSNL